MTNFSLAQNVKDLRDRKGISQENLAEESGLSIRTIQRIENNETVPRGDTLKRLSAALDTSPEEIVGRKIQEDQNYLILMSLSGLGFLFYPLLGIIIPLIMWVLKKDKLKSVNKLGKAILNFQISYGLLLLLYYLLILAGVFSMFIPLSVFYVFNIAVTIYNTIRIYNKKSFKYKPAFRFLR
ncbi:helix-turn-helix domain-containing protein [Winogradskyella immobilis]|uniref:Helix-turn-helix domain-containing protein n=1 Tax=Winogradskyella immobilis TaxID=2816852 RepID=A0ABS8EMA6_9FLAO|nr:helix-turn-helix domain-containing protein [Winogradskyella immobilis]MCC1484142.1 helix-turn-helix domain-containing protein [Winogradskyella immobilis]MCG0016234.1 helix-turn-helix domain-containing protein [Winogradskyella immobilis]